MYLLEPWPSRLSDWFLLLGTVRAGARHLSGWETTHSLPGNISIQYSALPCGLWIGQQLTSYLSPKQRSGNVQTFTLYPQALASSLILNRPIPSVFFLMYLQYIEKYI